jgi:AcrR family transcriptional regulator
VLAAMRLFWEKGYYSTSIADVLHTAKVNSGSLYHFFPGKTDLLAAVLDRYHEGIRPMLLEPAWAGVNDPIERVFALLARYRKSLLDTDCSYGCPIGSLALELHEPDLAVRERLARNFSAWIDAIAECLSQAKARLSSDLDRQELAQFVLTVMEGGVMQARTFREIEYFDAAVRQLRQYFKCLERAGGFAVGKPGARSQTKKTPEKNAA